MRMAEHWTKHIQEEKEKSIEIVNQLLPRVVADDLKGWHYYFYKKFSKLITFQREILLHQLSTILLQFTSLTLVLN